MGEVVAEERRRRGEGGARGRQCAAAVGVRERGQPASPGQRPVDARAMLPLAGVEHEGVLRQQRGSPAPSFATQTRVQESLPGQGNAGRQRVAPAFAIDAGSWSGSGSGSGSAKTGRRERPAKGRVHSCARAGCRGSRVSGAKAETGAKRGRMTCRKATAEHACIAIETIGHN